MAVVEAISTTYLEADAANITFSSIPSTYEHLQVCGTMHTNNGSDALSLFIQMGDGGSVDTGSNYSHCYMTGQSSTAEYSGNVVSATYFRLYDYVGGINSPIANYGYIDIMFMDYTDTNKNCSYLECGGFIGTGDKKVAMGVGVWDDTAAVDIIKFYPAGGVFSRGTNLTLYGWNSS